MRKLLFAFPLVLLFLYSCSSDVEDELLETLNDDTDTTTIIYTYSYSSDISPIIQGNCQPCHGTGPFATAVPLESYSELSDYHTPSLMIDYLESGYMPVGGTLHDSLINKIEIWFDEGAPNN